MAEGKVCDELEAVVLKMNRLQVGQWAQHRAEIKVQNRLGSWLKTGFVYS